MSTKSRIQFRLTVRQKRRAMLRAEALQFRNLSEYFRWLLQSDLKGEGPSHFKEREILLACSTINQKLDFLVPQQLLPVGQSTGYENLRNAIIASALMHQDPRKLRIYFARLFQGELEV
ncbi:MAG: hypothetical protein A2600_07610 [Candidatus Lambdaproteobacteria bacterium RIFOXYD1_FULL_56_27]|nr:MAG: hypothetical protein A2426_08250 [Candidatus Lambdaproteobacteria bacterium RIFOXYC1_FULL_56_13]OGH09633.1 MAG: hypothetical protein A2600_07610 [Candidatus Lambdaproteobacteria bacterium RIFOXYD1_FULL_56_27]